MVLVKKWPFFHVFYFLRYSPGKCVLQHSRKKKAFLAYQNNMFKELKIWDFSKGVHLWFWSNKEPKVLFFHAFFCNIGQKNEFYNILEQKNAFLAYKNNTFKKSKNWDFSKRVNPWFWSNKEPFLHVFFLDNIDHENFFLQYFRTKKRFSSL